jgi:osmotically-inducible protein OsmY
VGRGAVELRGWVPSRSVRTIAGRTALAVPGIESVINSILVRGEDDRSSPDRPRAADQSA